MVKLACDRIGRARLLTALMGAGLVLAVVALLTAASGDNTANTELGQVDFTHSTVDFVRGKGFDFSAVTPSSGIAVDSGNGCVYVADQANNRVLGWRNEASFVNGATADLIIGQHDQWSDQANTGGVSISTLSNPVGVATDPSGNLYIADQGNQRVVEYNAPCTGFNPFTGNLTIPVGDPWGVAVDITGNLFVADRNNNRVLEFNTPLDSKSGEPGAGDAVADNIFGQTTGTGCNQGLSAPTQATLCMPYGVGTDGTDVYVADTGNNRVVAFVPTGMGVFANDPSAVLVLGQRNFKSAVAGCAGGTTATSLCAPHGVAIDSSRNVYIADTNNNRVLEFNDPAGYSGSTPEAASMIIGQSNPTDNAANAGATASVNGLWQPAGVTTDSSGNLFVLDDHNFRALEFDETLPNPINSVPDRELGQLDFTHGTVDFVDGSAFSNLSGVAVDRNSTPQHLYVVDSNNNRVLGYNDATSFTNGAAADLVIGQSDLFTTICNTNNVSTSPPTASGLCLSSNPNAEAEGADAAVDSQGNLWVADVGNGRVLEFKAPFKSGFVAGEQASVVLGQPDFTTGRIGTGCALSTASNFCEPAGMAFDSSGDLYVADFGASRVLEFTQPANYNGPAPQSANLVIGQGNGGNDFSGSACNPGADNSSPTADTLCKPMGVAVDAQNNLYVADFDNNRVLEYDNPLTGAGTPGSPGSSGDVTADLVFGQGITGGTSEFTTAGCNTGGISANSLCFPSGVSVDPFGSLFITDQTNNRVLGYMESNNPPGNVIAGIEFGQGTSGTVFNSNTRNLGGLSATSLNFAVIPGQQDGITTDSVGDVFVVDAGNIRLLDYNGGFLSAPTPTTTITPTGSGTPTATPSETATATITPSRTATPSPVAVRLTVTPKSLTFKKEVAIGLNGVTSPTKTVTLKTPKKGPAITITNFSAAAPFSIDSSVSNACLFDQQIAPGAKCEIGIAYTPTIVGKQVQSLVINNNGESHKVSIPLTGTGIAGKLTTKPSTLNLKTVAVGTTSAVKTITLTNSNSLPIGLTGGISITGTDAAEFNETDDCGGTLTANSFCTISVTFTPSVTGKQTADLSISDVLPDSPQVVKLKGTGK